MCFLQSVPLFSIPGGELWLRFAGDPPSKLRSASYHNFTQKKNRHREYGRKCRKGGDLFLLEQAASFKGHVRCVENVCGLFGEMIDTWTVGF